MNSGDGPNPETEQDIQDSCADRYNPSVDKKGIGWIWNIISKFVIKFGGYSKVEQFDGNGKQYVE